MLMLVWWNIRTLKTIWCEDELAGLQFCKLGNADDVWMMLMQPHTWMMTSDDGS